MNDLEEIIYKHALLNAAKHKGSANPGAVMGSIMANEPELRSKAKEIGPMSGKIVAKVNALSPEEQASEMEKLGVEVQDKKPKAKEVGLQELPSTFCSKSKRSATYWTLPCSSSKCRICKKA